MDPTNRLEEVVYLPNMGARLHQFRSRIPGKALETVLLDSQAYQCLSAGPILANCSKKVWSEADVEFHFRTTQGHFVAQGMNIVDGHDQDDQERYYPRKGKPGRSPASSSFPSF